MTIAARHAPCETAATTIPAAERIRTAFLRSQRALQISDSAGRGTAVTSVRVSDGLTCQIEDGPWKLTADLKQKAGGAERGPDPGVLGRAALGSCAAMGYVMWAARLGVPLASVAVEVRADYDSRGMYGVGDVSPVYREVRYAVSIESDAPAADIMRVLDEADKHSSYINVFRMPLNVKREVRLRAPERT